MPREKNYVILSVHAWSANKWGVMEVWGEKKTLMYYALSGPSPHVSWAPGGQLDVWSLYLNH